MKVLVPFADGVEEMECVIVIDVLRRADWEVTSVSISEQTVTASRGVRLVADSLWRDIDPSIYDLLVLPGGAENARALAAHAGILETIRCFAESGRIVAAICAAPLALQEAGVLDGCAATCHPGVRKDIGIAVHRDERVVTAGNIITSQGPGTAFEFALALVTRVDGPDKAAELARALVL